MDIASTQVEAELNAFLDRQASKVREARPGQQAANRLEAVWAASERRVLEKRREENRQAWCERYRSLSCVHLRLAKDFRKQARKLETGHNQRGEKT